MRQERRTFWHEWRCDLEGCTALTTTHPALKEADPPAGWITIAPPRYWKGPPLAFCGPEHARAFATGVVAPALGGVVQSLGSGR